MKIGSMFKLFFFSSLLAFSMQSFADAPLSDSTITATVKEKMAHDSLLKRTPINVDVSTKDQVVSFAGAVNSESEAKILVQLAESTLDVKDVDTSNLVVKDSHQPLTDSYITAKVKGKFIKEKVFGDVNVSAWTIKVETNDGIVTLTGKADSKAQVENAIKIAQSVSGVQQVKFRIQIVKDHIATEEMKNY